MSWSWIPKGGHGHRFEKFLAKKQRHERYRWGKGRLIKRVQRLERGMSGREVKLHDLSTNASFATAGALYYVTGIAQGDQSINREGLSINLLGISLKFDITTDAACTTNQFCRVMLVCDTMNQGATPAVTDILEAATVYDYPEHENRNRFRIMYDKRIPCNNNFAAVKGMSFNYYKRFKKPVKVFYSGTGSAVADAGRNAFFLVTVGHNATALPGYRITGRTWFSD